MNAERRAPDEEAQPTSSTGALRPQRPSPAPRRGFAERALDAIYDGVVLVDADGGVRYLNAAAAGLTGWSEAEACGEPLGRVLPVVDAHGTALFANLAGASAEGAAERGGMALFDRDGVRHPVRVRVRPFDQGGGLGDGYMVVLSDRSAEAGLRQRLSFHARHDALTGLPNRQCFEEHLAGALAECAQDDAFECAVLYIDVDQFKVVNDTCGHAVGDRFLVQLAECLRERVRGSDRLARLGGDEFAILLYGCSIDSAVAVAKELRRLVRQLDFSWEGKPFAHTVSIGVARATGPEQEVAAILSAADVACFAAKDRGRDRVEVYHSERVPERHVEMQWVARVARACDEDRLLLYQQPIVALDGAAGGRPHYELLLRMVDRFGQVILPGCFIGAAERYNLMPRIDRWTVSQTLRHLVWRPDMPEVGSYTLSLNLSGTSLSDPAFLDYVLEQLDEAPIERGTLCFEITETAAIADIGHVAHFMHEVRERGCLFSLDDFGSGLSSFAYLRELPVDYLKIDGRFIRNLCSDRANVAVVEAFSRIGRALNIKTVAERVESASVAGMLARLGVDFAQGFFYAEPRKVRNRFGFPGIPSVVSTKPTGA